MNYILFSLHLRYQLGHIYTKIKKIFFHTLVRNSHTRTVFQRATDIETDENDGKYERWEQKL